jgi:acyl carrier protein
LNIALRSGEQAQMNVRSDIVDLFSNVAQEQGIPLAPLTDDLALLDSGLDSLCFAIVVARLEGLLGVDPFSSSEDILFPVTFGEFVKFYDNATN